MGKSASKPFRFDTFPKVSAGDELVSLHDDVSTLSIMDKETMGGRCIPETERMEKFMQEQILMENIPNKYFVGGVRAFSLRTELKDRDPDTILHFPAEDATPRFSASIVEVLEWQSSYQAYAIASEFTSLSREDQDGGGEGDQKDDTTATEGGEAAALDKKECEKDDPTASSQARTLARFLQGKVGAGAEAFAMKFVVRISRNPILCAFDAVPISRAPASGVEGEEQQGAIYLASVCGVDFAGRGHDSEDIKRYIPNWREVYSLHPDTGDLYVHMGRDFVATGAPAELDEKALLVDLRRMLWLRLLALDQSGVQIVIESALGLGIFAGDKIGIGARVRALSAQALRLVLEEELALQTSVLEEVKNHPTATDGSSAPLIQKAAFKSIKCIVMALPIFDEYKTSNYYHYHSEFSAFASGCCPVWLVDHDMHVLALCAARRGLVASELNPADSHGVFGEYWQNKGPGTEEKLALTTLGLLTQHHAVNLHVREHTRYFWVDL